MSHFSDNGRGQFPKVPNFSCRGRARTTHPDEAAVVCESALKSAARRTKWRFPQSNSRPPTKSPVLFRGRAFSLEDGLLAARPDDQAELGLGSVLPEDALQLLAVLRL